MIKSAVFVSSLVILIISAASDGQEQTTVAAGLLFEQKCGVCHTIERPKTKRKTRDEWGATVMRMKNVNRAPITEEEALIIIDYLAGTYGK